MHDRLDESQVDRLTADAENGINSKDLADALRSMPFEDRHDALLQIQQKNENNRVTNPKLPALTVDLKLDDENKSETVTLRRTCDAFGPKGEPRYDYTHNFGPNRVDTSMYAGNSILCPGNDTSSGGRAAGGGGASSPDIEGPAWGGKSKSGGGGGGGTSEKSIMDTISTRDGVLVKTILQMDAAFVPSNDNGLA